jgi:hypothetical protein
MDLIIQNFYFILFFSLNNRNHVKLKLILMIKFFQMQIRNFLFIVLFHKKN